MSKPKTRISPQKFDAVIFDMDGVVTRTAHVHAAAWKKMFDAFLEQRAAQTGKSFEPFSIDRDYNRYVDGKPRYDGVRDFLESRGIELPEGASDDDPDQATVCGLGNRKNRYFRQELEEKGARRYDSTVAMIDRLKQAGIKTAIISASKNARQVLAAAGVADLFDARVDGLDAQDQGLPGKPAPDVFLAAARQLAVDPARAVVVEDAQSGVEAGRKGNFGLVIGVNRGDQAEELARFADVVVDDLAEVAVDVEAPPARAEKTTDDLPSALDRFNTVTARLEHRRPAVFLDYDGTLTPIVDRPEQARISDEMRQTVTALGRLATVAIVSGRDRPDVESLAGIEDICYAGSHGFDIARPGGEQIELQQGTEYLPALDRAEQALRARLRQIDGAQVERKKFAIAVHFRRVAAERQAEVERAVDTVLEESPGLRKTGGKKIFELRPDIDWDKGKALQWLLKKLDLDHGGVIPLYLGDDLTDEDALRVVEQDGIGILVRDESRPTHAHFALEDPAEVGIFLRRLCDYLEERNES